MPVNFTPALIDQIIKGRCADFAAMMGMRKTKNGELQINTFLPGATAVEVVQRNGRKVLATLTALHPEGLFSGTMPGKKAVPYKLRAHYGTKVLLRDDPYRFPSCLDKAELQLFTQGQHDSAWQLLGARPFNYDDVEGVHFVVWAPTAHRVSLLCESNRWDGRCHVMRRHPAFGLWELFMPDFLARHDSDDAAYKFELLTAGHECRSLPFDPFARKVSKHPVFCTRLETEPVYQWLDHFWQQVERDFSAQGRAISIREIAFTAAADEGQMNWKQLAPLVLEQTRDAGFTHMLLTTRSALAVSAEQTVCGLLVPDPALGSPNDLRSCIDRAHELELGVLWDVPLLSVLYSLGYDEKPLALLEPELLEGPLLSIFLGYFSYWRTSFHIDGFRVRDVDILLQLQAPMVPVQTKRKQRHNTSATGNAFVKEWLSRLLQKLRDLHPGLLMVVETRGGDEPLTAPVNRGGFGFDYRIFSGANKSAPVRSDFGAMIAEQVMTLQDGNRDQRILSLPWQQLLHSQTGTAEDRQSWLASMMLALWTLPGRKHVQLDYLLQPGTQWNPDAGHDWQLQWPAHWSDDMGRLMRELNLLYQSNPCLYEIDASHEGITVLPTGPGIVAYQRMGRHANDVLLVVLNVGNSAVTAEISAGNAGIYHLRYQTPALENQSTMFPKVVHSQSNSGVNADVNRGHKLALPVPARSAAIYAWQG